MEQISCCCFDLETTNLSADFGVVLCGVIKPADGTCKVFRADKLNPKWLTTRSNDKRVVQAIVQELSQYDIWIAHNGNRFDVPFLRTRLAKWGLEALPAKKLIDPVFLARNKMKMSYNSLKSLAQFLGVDSKTEVSGDYWLQAALDGNTRAMTYIVDHCVQDVLVLEKVVKSLKAYSTTYNAWGSGF